MAISSVLLATAVVLALIVVNVWRIRHERQRRLDTIQCITINDIESKALDEIRPIIVYLPPQYERYVSANHTFPVLYVNDGQDYRAWRLHETLADLTSRGEIRPIIVVAIPMGEKRLDQYGTVVAPNAQGLGLEAPAYRRFVIEELLPEIDGRFHTCGPAVFLGASLGGLSAFDIAWHNRQYFRAVGVMSGSFWWRAAEDETRTPPNKLIAHETVKRGPYTEGFKAWFQAGTRDEVSDRDANGVIDAIQDTTELIEELETLGYKGGIDIVYRQVEGGHHDYETWSTMLPEFLRWAFGSDVPINHCP